MRARALADSTTISLVASAPALTSSTAGTLCSRAGKREMSVLGRCVSGLYDHRANKGERTLELSQVLWDVVVAASFFFTCCRHVSRVFGECVNDHYLAKVGLEYFLGLLGRG